MEQNFINFNNLEKLNKISNLNSSNEKIALAKMYSSNPEFVELVLAAYNPFKQYKIKKIKNINVSTTKPQSIVGFLEKMSMKDAANNGDISDANYIVSSLDVELACLFVKVLKKDLKVGMNVDSWNKAGYEIPVFKLQLAQSPKYVNTFLKENSRFAIQTKYDGNRAVCYINKNEVTFYTREGHIINSCDALKRDILSLNIPYDMILDGEIMHKSLILQKAQSIISKKNSDHGKGDELIYCIFDILKISQVNCENYSYEDRYLELEKLNTDYFHNSNSLHVAPITYYPLNDEFDENYIANAQAYIMTVFNKVVREGQEGLILKNLQAPYERSRTRNWVKVKQTDNIDLPVIELIEGEVGSKYENMLGAAVCALDDTKTVNIGSGWTDQERLYFWNNKNELLGKTLEIKYTMLSPDGIPLHPSKKVIRVDK